MCSSIGVFDLSPLVLAISIFSHQTQWVLSFLCCWFRLLSRQISFSQPREDHGSHNQHMQQRADHASQHGGGERLHHFGSSACRPHDRQQTRHNRGYGHDLRTQTQKRTFHHRFTQSLYSESAHRDSLSLHGLFQIDHHHNAGLYSGTEQGDETDPNSNREVVSQELQEEYASAQRERYGEDHVRGLF